MFYWRMGVHRLGFFRNIYIRNIFVQDLSKNFLERVGNENIADLTNLVVTILQRCTKAVFRTDDTDCSLIPMDCNFAFSMSVQVKTKNKIRPSRQTTAFIRGLAIQKFA